MGKGGRERGHWPLGIEEKERDRQTQRKEGWEVGRALLKGNVVNVHRGCSNRLQLRK